MEDKVKVICITPVRNEAWILKTFLESTSLWADYIIIADQKSTDGSRAIATKYPKVILVDNDTDTFNEPERTRLLISEARKINGPRLIVALDADEMFSPEIFFSKQWSNFKKASAGTVAYFYWANLRHNLKKYTVDGPHAWAFIDDGNNLFDNTAIHTNRIPLSSEHNKIIITDFYVMHYQYLDWNRMKSKHRYYQCYERLQYPSKAAIKIYRIYHHMYNPNLKAYDVPKTWKDEYFRRGVDITLYVKEMVYRWDKEVHEFVRNNKKGKFSNIDIWDLQIIREYKVRSIGNFLFLAYCHLTTKLYYKKRWKVIVRFIDEKLLSIL